MESVSIIEVETNKKRQNWSDNDVLILIHVWSEYIEELRANKRNKKNYQKMSEVFGASADCARSADEVKNKLGNLTRDYRREKARMVSGASPSTWKFYKPLHALLGSLPSNNDDLLDDSLSVVPAVTNEEEICLEELFGPDETSSSNMTWNSGTEEFNSSAGSSASFSGLGMPQRRRTGKRAATEDVSSLLKDLLDEQKRANNQAKDSEEKALELLKKDSENQHAFQNNVLKVLTNLLQKNDK